MTGLGDSLVHNRRKEQRKILREPAEVAFYHNGGLHWGSMVDLSTTGARFVMHLKKGDAIPPLSKSRRLECCITNSMGTSKCKGTVQWSSQHDGILEWGYSFTDISTEEDDPLYAAIRYHFKREKNHTARKAHRKFAKAF